MASGINQSIGKNYIDTKTKEPLVGESFLSFTVPFNKAIENAQKEAAKKSIKIGKVPTFIVGKPPADPNMKVLVSVAIFKPRAGTPTEKSRRYFIRIQPAGTNPGSVWPKETLKPFITRDTGAASKEALPLKPSQLIGSGSFTPESLAKVVESNAAVFEKQGKLPKGMAKKLGNAIRQTVAGKLPVVDGLDGLEGAQTAVRDYLGEILAPVAFLSGAGIQGPKLKDVMIGFGTKPKGMPEIVFNAATNEGLIDSKLVWKQTNQEIGLSSKGGKGASASIASVFNLFQKVEKDNPTLFKSINSQYKTEIAAVRAILNLSSKTSPVAAAYWLGMIDKKDIPVIVEILKTDLAKSDYEVNPFGDKKPDFKLKPGELDQTQFRNTNLGKDLKKFGPRLSPRLLKLLSLKEAKDVEKASLGFFILANLAKAVAETINNSKNIRFNELFKALFGASQFVQIYANTNVTDTDSVAFTSFKTVYPPTFEGKILVEGDKSYYATRPPQGGLGFKFVS